MLQPGEQIAKATLFNKRRRRPDQMLRVASDVTRARPVSTATSRNVALYPGTAQVSRVVGESREMNDHVFMLLQGYAAKRKPDQLFQIQEPDCQTNCLHKKAKWRTHESLGERAVLHEITQAGGPVLICINSIT